MEIISLIKLKPNKIEKTSIWKLKFLKTLFRKSVGYLLSALDKLDPTSSLKI